MLNRGWGGGEGNFVLQHSDKKWSKFWNILKCEQVFQQIPKNKVAVDTLDLLNFDLPCKTSPLRWFRGSPDGPGVRI